MSKRTQVELNPEAFGFLTSVRVALEYYDHWKPTMPGRLMEIMDVGIGKLREAVGDLCEAQPTTPHPGGRLVKVVAHYEDGSTQTIDGEVILNALDGVRVS